jgi:hypothetical protein
VTDAIISLRQIDALLENIQHKQKYTNGDLVAMVLATEQIEKIDGLLEQKEKEVREQRGMDADIRTPKPTYEKKRDRESDRKKKQHLTAHA